MESRNIGGEVFETGFSESVLSEMVAIIEDSSDDRDIQERLSDQFNLPVIIYRDIRINSNTGGIFVSKGETVVAGYTVEKALSNNPDFSQALVNFKVVLKDTEVDINGSSRMAPEYIGIVNIKGITCILSNKSTGTYDFLAVLDSQK